MIAWFKDCDSLFDSDTYPVRHMVTLHADGTYLTSSKTHLTPSRFEHNITIQCLATKMSLYMFLNLDDIHTRLN